MLTSLLSVPESFPDFQPPMLPGPEVPTTASVSAKDNVEQRDFGSPSSVCNAAPHMRWCPLVASLVHLIFLFSPSAWHHVGLLWCVAAVWFACPTPQLLRSPAPLALCPSPWYHISQCCPQCSISSRRSCWWLRRQHATSNAIPAWGLPHAPSGATASSPTMVYGAGGPGERPRREPKPAQ